MPARAIEGGRVLPLAPTGAPRAAVADMQRARLLLAAVQAVDELGYEAATVAQITGRARVSRRTFYDLFANREDCLAAVLDHAVAQIEAELAAADLAKLAWRERVRMGLWTILCFLERERALARACVVQLLHGGPAALAQREQLLARLAAVLDEGRTERPGSRCVELTAEGLVGAAFMIVNARIPRAEQRLTGLLGELMGMIVLPYQGAGAARREQERPLPKPTAPAPGDEQRLRESVNDSGDPLEGVTMRLTYRTARVLEGIAARPGVSNRQIAEQAGIQDQGQVSKLLARLERLGLLVNTGGGAHLRGEANAWTLTGKGARVTQNIGIHSTPGARAA
jgi:AcrR family transcriptional regulator